MRNGEIFVAGILALFSVYLMVKSAELPIGFVSGRGPGGGAWPFWLSAIMLVCCGFIAFNWWRGTSPPSRSEEPFLDSYGWRMVITVGGALIVFVALIEVISMYGAIAVFLLYYLRFLGRHSWGLSLTISLATPLIFFFFFEGAMRITMPTGLPFTDPLFDLLYEIIY
ncbi:tripartite tricarboxylate transporter TctB family protein [Roseibacterium sp. SDUM158016]|uniref:tripartite tricarboxylate transporter TctB family protein n=1 Tax=Roseicyclus sediminis TaxID=2980997 RepID=UPI0021D01DCE|nr:tripartite tricarboxylate transporter TctB family protein [Roseibacterium sp. SDUM158016]MCU4651701.1 tripartite tricarboxylate transporter TctB family protein [Roseibacterium sp. SDUM158016]